VGADPRYARFVRTGKYVGRHLPLNLERAREILSRSRKQRRSAGKEAA
jgi:hypothetical protein